MDAEGSSEARPEVADVLLKPGTDTPFSWSRVAKVLLVLMAVAYFAAIHPWFMNWGATAEEQRMALPGDELLQNATERFTRAITVEASPAVVWQWITQMGQERGGFYSNTWLENLTGGGLRATLSLPL